MKDYQTWSFFNRSFLLAAGLSLVWHFFWFFAVTIVVSPPKRPPRVYPKVISLGPVFDDSILRTLAEARPQLSEAFYRGPSLGLSEPAAAARTIERQTPGDTVGLPSGNRFLNAMKMFFEGDKASPDLDWMPQGLGEAAPRRYTLTGDLADRMVLSRPPDPAELPPSEALIDLTVDEAGAVERVEIARSGGDSRYDTEWAAFAQGWRFAARSGAGTTKGRLAVRAARTEL